MYLTRFQIIQSRIGLGWLANPYRVHQRLCMAYPAEERLLFRVEENEAGSVILAQSQDVPDWQAAFGEFEVLAREPETKSFLLQLALGGMYHFRLLANPTVTREKKRLGLLKEEDQRAWLERQLDRSGACLLGCQVAAKGLQRSRKNPRKAEGHQTHLAVLYEGVLRVENVEGLAEAVKAGIGHAKAYGFGLMSLAKYR